MKNYNAAMAAAHSVFELLDMPEEDNHGTLTPDLKGNLQFKNVNLVIPMVTMPFMILI